jgi:GNAT superfamily N-acetyltransferase
MMMRPEDIFAAVCRPALPKDTGQVLKFTREIWEGEDYVPHVWEQWLHDFQGFLAVAEYSGQVAAIGRLKPLSPDEWWLEGLRVDPKFQSRGIASHLHAYILSYWERNGTGVVRLGTASTRQPIHHLCARYHFSKIGEYSLFKAPVLDQQVTSYTPIARGHVTDAMQFIQASPLYRLSFGLMDHGWEWSIPSTAHLLDAIHNESAWWWRDRQGLLIYRDEWEGKHRYPLLQLLACPLESLADCLLDYRRQGTAAGHEEVAWLAPLQSEVQVALTTAGFERDWDDALVIYEKKHPSVT